jgi:hypothetical protein
VPKEVWVIDTSSLVEIRRFVPIADRKALFDELTKKLQASELTFPRAVLTEFERPKDTVQHDHAWEWVKKHVDHCEVHEPLYDRVVNLLKNPQINRVLDAEKDCEEADPYVLALALAIRDSGAPVAVLTEEKRTRPSKLALSEACGLLRIPALRIEPYLEQQGIWPV